MDPPRPFGPGTKADVPAITSIGAGDEPKGRGADHWTLDKWVSEGFTTAMVLEAMSKYALAYDQSGRSIRDTGRLKLSRQQAGGTLDVQLSPK